MATTLGSRTDPVTDEAKPVSDRRRALRAHPPGFGFLALMRDIERSRPDLPRIARNRTLKEESVRLGQDPFLAFPDCNVTHFDDGEGHTQRVRSNFLGYFGPQGALPLNTTAEVYQWFRDRDQSFVRLTDLFTSRFQQLFFRAWSDARGITQFDHPEDDRFQTYIGAFIGQGSRPLRDRDRVRDVARLPLAGVAVARVKSPARLKQMIEALCGVQISIDEHIPTWLPFEPSDLTRLGASGSTLGVNCRLGARVQGVNEKIRLNVRTESLAEYQSYLPGGVNFGRLTDILFRYLGHEVEVEIAPALPADQVKGMSLGTAGALGWTGWIAPPTAEPGHYRSDAVFSSER
jgi:type VI secretion system protein ImpH